MASLELPAFTACGSPAPNSVEWVYFNKKLAAIIVAGLHLIPWRLLRAHLSRTGLSRLRDEQVDQAGRAGPQAAGADLDICVRRASRPVWRPQIMQRAAAGSSSLASERRQDMAAFEPNARGPMRSAAAGQGSCVLARL